jgi:hypothetical protein
MSRGAAAARLLRWGSPAAGSSSTLRHNSLHSSQKLER